MFDVRAAVVPFWFAWHRMVLLQLIIIFLELATVGWIQDSLGRDGLWPGVVVALVVWGLIKGAIAPPLLRRRKPGTVRESVAHLVGTVAFVALVAWGLSRIGQGKVDSISRGMMRSALSSVLDAQDAYFRDHRSYTPTPDSATTGVRVYVDSTVQLHFGEVSTTGWNATATRSGSRYVCGIHDGTAPPPLPSAVPRRPTCEKR